MITRWIKSRLGAIARELGVYVEAAGQQGHRKLVFFPSQGLDDGAARLRAYAVAAELRLLGWQTLVVPKHLGLRARRRLLRYFKPNIIVFQTARHPLNRPHLFKGFPAIVDLDDADYIDPISRQPLVEALRDSVGVIAGSRSVARFCRRYNANVSVVWTGAPPTVEPPSCRSESRIITWAASSPMGSPAEAAFVSKVLHILSDRDVDYSFRIYCDDGSPEYLKFVKTIVPNRIDVQIFPYLPYDEFLSTLDAVCVGLAPLIDMEGFSGGKSFGKILAYIDRHVPVVTHAVVDHPLFFSHGENGLLLASPDEWATAIADLLDDPGARERMSKSARADMLRRLSAPTSARLVDQFLTKCLASRVDVSSANTKVEEPGV